MKDGEGVAIALVTLDEDRLKVKYMFNTTGVLVKEGDRVLVETAKGIKPGTVIAHGLTFIGTNEANLLWEINNRRDIRPVLCRIDDLPERETISLKGEAECL